MAPKGLQIGDTLRQVAALNLATTQIVIMLGFYKGCRLM